MLLNFLATPIISIESDRSKSESPVIVLGSGVYRIGSSVEFDWCAVHCIRTLREKGIKCIMVNFNPETVSTDYDEADKLYFENIDLETVLDIYEAESSCGVIVSMGGQTANNIALQLSRQNVKIIGTDADQIDNAENRFKFSRMLDQIHVDQPKWKELTNLNDAKEFCSSVQYPVLVRPSYVLSGAAMNVVFSEEDLQNYLEKASFVSKDHPVVISKFIEDAKEIEMDAVALNGRLLISIISEHVENAGVHSGDATLILPPQDLDSETVEKVKSATAKIAALLNVTGPFNIQFIAKNNEIKVIECNLRASRSFPFVSKVIDINMIQVATCAMMGIECDINLDHKISRDSAIGVKVPQFSFGRLLGADPVLGVEMASTGEVACFGKDKYEAYLKALLATGFTLPKKNILISIGSFKEKIEFLPFAKKLVELGYNLFATSGTGDFMLEHNIPVKCLEVMECDGVDKQEYNASQYLSNNLIDLYINLPSKNKYRRPANYISKGYVSRRLAVDFSVPLITNIKCAKLFVQSLMRYRNSSLSISSYDFKSAHKTFKLNGFIAMNCSAHSSSFYSAALKNGFFVLCSSSPPISNATGPFALCFKDFSVKVCNQIADLHSEHHKLYLTSLKGMELAAFLFTACNLSKNVHVTDLDYNDFVLLKAMKDQGKAVSFDLNLLAFDKNVEMLAYADAFSLGDDEKALDSVFPFISSLLTEGIITEDSLRMKLYENPRRLLGIDTSNVPLIYIESGQEPRIERFSDEEVSFMADGKLLMDGKKIENTVTSEIASLGPSCNLDFISIEKQQISNMLKFNVFYGRSILTCKQFDRNNLRLIFNVAHELANLCSLPHETMQLLKGKILGTFFYEPSTRTSCSFQSAMLKLGGRVINVNEQFSSSCKGESFLDTMKVMQSYVDILVLRHPEKGMAELAGRNIQIPIINGGDGVGEHPTQALLDVYTIRQELGSVSGISVALIGDLKNGRTVHSLVRLLALYNCKLFFITPEGLEMPSEIIEELKKSGISIQTAHAIEDVISFIDVLYVTRIQKERGSSSMTKLSVTSKVFNFINFRFCQWQSRR